ncbi:MAG: manganese efflux pump [Caldisericia bacterium]|nr:manganese efflux pump [Caldisericia bacterium]
MGLTEITIIAIGLSADSFAVASSIGSTFKKMRIRYAALLATIATSIDSLAVGVSLSLLEIDIFTPVIIIS